MKKREHAIPEPNRSAAEIEFVLRNSKRRGGPELLRDLARADKAKAPPKEEKSPPKEEKAPRKKAGRRGRQAEAETEPRKSWL